MDFKEFVKPELLILIPVLYALGAWFKGIEGIKNWTIPFVLCGIGITVSFLYLLATEFSMIGNLVAAYIFTAFTQGVLCAGAAVLANQGFKQLTVGRESDNAGTKPE